jgi:type I restriction enzyme, R subunit
MNKIEKLIKKYHEEHTKDKEILVDINKAIDSSVELRNKKDLIHQFIESLNKSSEVEADWQKFVEKKKIEELDAIIKEENLDSSEAYKFIENAFRDGNVPTAGTAIAKVLPPVSRFSKTGERSKKRETIVEKFTRFFERFFEISKNQFE